MTWSKRCSQSTSQGSSLMSPFQKPRKDSCPGHWPQWPFTDLDDRVPHPVRLPAGSWVEMLDDAKDEFEADGTAAVFSTWRVEEEDPLDIGDVEIADGMRARAGRLALDAQMADERAARLLDSLPEGQFLLKLKFLREKAEDDWVLEDLWSNPGWAKEGPGGHRGLPGHEAWRVDWNWQCVLPECLPHHRCCLRPLPHQGPGPCQPSSLKNWWPQLCGSESFGAFRERFERPWTHPRGDGSYKIGWGGSMRLEPRLTMWLNWRRSSGDQSSWGTLLVNTSSTAANISRAIES